MSVHRAEEEHEKSVFYVETGMETQSKEGELQGEFTSIAKACVDVLRVSAKNKQFNLPTSVMHFSLYALILYKATIDNFYFWRFLYSTFGATNIIFCQLYFTFHQIKRRPHCNSHYCCCPEIKKGLTA